MKNRPSGKYFKTELHKWNWISLQCDGNTE